MIEQISGSNIYTVDALYERPNLAAIHLIRANDRIAIVDTGTQYSVDEVDKALTKLSLNWQHVDYIILTHIHLDHAGGASVLMSLCPNAKLIVHPKGARHMVDPSKLVAGSIAVYGEEQFSRIYGEITPIDKQRIIEPADNAIIQFEDRPLLFIDTPGHASHHHCIIDQKTNSAFTGDTLGIGYPALRNNDQVFLFPTTTPIQFNPQALHHSIDRVMQHNPNTLYLTHYGAIQPSNQLIAGLHEQIDAFVMLTQQAAEQQSDQIQATLAVTIADYLQQRFNNEVGSSDQKKVKDWLAFDAKLNAQGLAFWWQHRRTV